MIYFLKLCRQLSEHRVYAVFLLTRTKNKNRFFKCAMKTLSCLYDQ